MRLYIIRHADPDYSTDSITQDGHKEAQSLARRMAAQGVDKIYCSPMGRAVITAKYTADALGIEYNIEKWTRELWPELSIENSPWGKIMAIDIPGEAFRDDENIDINRKWHESRYLSECKSSAEETFKNLQEFSDNFIARHGYEKIGGRYRIIKSNRDKIAVFCHGGFGLTWLAHLLEIPVHLMWAGFWLPPTSVTTVLFDERSEEWAVPRCLGLGDVSHLYESGLQVKPRGIIANYY